MSSCRSIVLALALAAGCLPGAAQTTCSGANVALLFGVYDVLNTSPTDTQADYLVTCTRSGGPQWVCESDSVAKQPGRFRCGAARGMRAGRRRSRAVPTHASPMQ